MSLLVENNDDVTIYTQTCLREEYQMIWAENGQIGIDQAIAITLDLILIDVMVPVICDTLKKDERTSHIQIGLITARSAIDDRLTGLWRGAMRT